MKKNVTATMNVATESCMIEFGDYSSRFNGTVAEIAQAVRKEAYDALWFMGKETNLVYASSRRLCSLAEAAIAAGMEEAKIDRAADTLVVAEVECDDYDCDLSHNGGSYEQPKYTLSGIGCKVVIDDSSCGDFGTRIDVDVEFGGTTYSACYGSMRSEDELFTDVPESLMPILDKIYDLTGYAVPYDSKDVGDPDGDYAGMFDAIAALESEVKFFKAFGFKDIAIDVYAMDVSAIEDTDEYYVHHVSTVDMTKRVVYRWWHRHDHNGLMDWRPSEDEFEY